MVDVLRHERSLRMLGVPAPNTILLARQCYCTVHSQKVPLALPTLNVQHPSNPPSYATARRTPPTPLYCSSQDTLVTVPCVLHFFLSPWILLSFFSIQLLSPLIKLSIPTCNYQHVGMVIIPFASFLILEHPASR